jgi:hypothetical protein
MRCEMTIDAPPAHAAAQLVHLPARARRRRRGTAYELTGAAGGFFFAAVAYVY